LRSRERDCAVSDIVANGVTEQSELNSSVNKRNS
jgi:hypothetical protein